MNRRSLLLLALLCSGATAQGVATFPSDHAAIPDGSSSIAWFPYSSGVSRTMALYERWDLLVPAGRAITRIGFRADAAQIALGKRLQLQVRMGSTTLTAQTMDPSYDNNWFGTPTTVFGPALFVMPDLNNPQNPNPDGSVIWLTLSTPFVPDATRNLLVEWRILANNNGGAAFSYPLDLATFDSPVVSGPSGCQHSGNQIPALASRPTAVGAYWHNDLTQAPSSQPVVLFLNLGTPLVPSYPLSPFLPGISPSCVGQIALQNLLSMEGVTTPWGSTTFSVPIPSDRVFNDLILSSQAFCLDFFSPGNLVVSNGDQVQIGIDPAMSLLWSTGSSTASSGSVYANLGVVTLFAHN